MESLRRDEYAVDPLELKALSVPPTLLFLLAVECDAALCMTTAGAKRKISLQFPALGTQAQRLLELVAARLGLVCTHNEGTSTLSGVGSLPVLRYIDFLPGQLHVDEVLASFGAKPVTQPVTVGGCPNAFIASFIDYSPYRDDTPFADLNNGHGYCMSLERGLPLGTHSHLVAIRFKGNKGASSDNIRQFQRFCGWNTFDLRFDEEGPKCATGVVVMPSVQDAMDLFEKYEDEDSDDEEDADALRFAIRPVAPLIPVPFVEDAHLRKFRQTTGNYATDFWATFEKTRNCVVVSNLYDKATILEVLKLFDGLTITDSSLVEDASPFRRRRAFITFADGAACREALGMDGKNTHGKALRIQVSPPYVDCNRRGHVVRSRSPSPSPQMTPATHTASGRSPSPIPDLALPAAVSPTQPTTTPVVKPASFKPNTSQTTPSFNPTTPSFKPNTSQTTPLLESASPEDSTRKTGMNAGAKEFIPKFAMSPLQSASSPPPPPPAYSPATTAAAPPPYMPTSPAMPPPYSPPPPYTVTPKSVATNASASATAPPAYSLPPPYVAQKSPALTAEVPPPPPPPSQ